MLLLKKVGFTVALLGSCVAQDCPECEGTGEGTATAYSHPWDGEGMDAKFLKNPKNWTATATTKALESNVACTLCNQQGNFPDNITIQHATMRALWGGNTTGFRHKITMEDLRTQVKSRVQTTTEGKILVFHGVTMNRQYMYYYEVPDTVKRFWNTQMTQLTSIGTDPLEIKALCKVLEEYKGAFAWLFVFKNMCEWKTKLCAAEKLEADAKSAAHRDIQEMMAKFHTVPSLKLNDYNTAATMMSTCTLTGMLNASELLVQKGGRERARHHGIMHAALVSIGFKPGARVEIKHGSCKDRQGTLLYLIGGPKLEWMVRLDADGTDKTIEKKTRQNNLRLLDESRRRRLLRRLQGF